MIKKKNAFWTFCFSFIPGAGEMYMGFMKMGVSLMSMFMLVIFVSYTLDMAAFLAVSAIVWFYGFFHVHNLRSLDEETFYALEDEFLFHVPELDFQAGEWGGRYRKVIGVGLVFWGAAMLWKNLWNIFDSWIPNFMQEIFRGLTYRLPQMVLAVVVIWIGVLMVRGKKQELYGDAPEEKEPEASVPGIGQKED